jgi:hypothetical protein
MGTFFNNNVKSYQEMAHNIVKEATQKIVAKALIGREFYVAYEFVDKEEKNQTGICLFLMTRVKGEYGYKPIGEESHPYYYACPERILKLSTQTCESSTLWRAKCRETIRRKAGWTDFVASLTPGQVIQKIEGGELNFLFAIDKRSIACKTPEGKTFRYNFKDFAY